MPAKNIEKLFNIALILFVTLGIIHYTIFSQKINPKLTNMTYDKVKLLNETLPLLNQTGHLVESGYHTKPVKSFNKQSIGKVQLGMKEQKYLRYKQLEYHWFQNSDYMLSFFFANINGLANSVGQEIYDINTKQLIRDENLVYLPWKVFDLNDDTMHFNTTFTFENNGLEISYNDKELDTYYQRIYHLKSNKLNFSGNFIVKKQKDHDGHFFAEQIFEEDARYWNSGYKEYGMEIHGIAALNNQKMKFDNNSRAMMESGRGVYSFKTNYTWMAFDTVLEDGTRLSLNCAGGMKQTENNYNNEDYLIINGKLITLDPIEFTHNWNYPMLVWTISSVDVEGHRKVNLQFSPKAESSAGQNLLFIKSDVKFLYGVFEGFINDEQGNEIQINEVNGQIHMTYLQI